MNTTTLEQPTVDLVKINTEINNGLTALNERKVKFEELRAKYSGLTINGVEDKKGLTIVSDARKVLKKERVQIEKEAKGWRDQVRVISTGISTKEKELLAIITPIEEELQAEEDKIESEKERIRAEKEAADKARIQARIDGLAKYGREIDYSDIVTMNDSTFEMFVATAKKEWEQEEAEKAEAECVRLQTEAKEKAEREAENLRLQKEREELERLRAEQAAAQRKLDEERAAMEAEKKKLQDEKDAEVERKRKEQEAFAREAELVKARAEAAEAEKKRIIEEARIAEENRKIKAEKDRIAAEKKAARQPDRTKIDLYLTQITGLPVPTVKTEEAAAVLSKIVALVAQIPGMVKKELEAL